MDPSLFITMIDFLRELTDAEVEFERVSDEEVKLLCPFHGDSSPSLFLNQLKGAFYCQACSASGDFTKLLARLLNKERTVVWKDLSTRYELHKDKTIEGSRVEKAYEALKDQPLLIDELEARGIDSELRRRYRIGAHNGRITIPIKNASGSFVNLRLYSPGAETKKMINSRGYGKPPRLYPIEQLEFEEIVVCGGELKAILAATQLNRHGVGAITLTAGEANWTTAATEALKSKRVWICLDIDEAGQTAAENLANVLYYSADWVRILRLPLDPRRYPKGDINDFIAQEGGNVWQELKDQIREEPWSPEHTRGQDDTAPPVSTDLSGAIKARYAGVRVEFVAQLSSKDTSPFILPKSVSVSCGRDQKYCQLCPVQHERCFDISAESPALLQLINGNAMKSRAALGEVLRIPRMCRVWEYEAKLHFTAEDCRLGSQLLTTSMAEDRQMVPAIVLSEKPVEVNETYKFIGRMHPNPDTNQASLVISHAEPAKDALTAYEPDPTGFEVFQCEDTAEAVNAKLTDVYEDFEANVTRIYQRPELHFVVDITYHSPLWIDFDGRRTKGWIESVVLGDSSQGKSDTVEFLSQHFDLGEIMSCKNASAAGLIGGLVSSGKRWFVQWGVLPTNDRRLAILEEFKGCSTDLIAKLTDTRSRGIAELTKIERRKALARCRLIAISNARGDRKVSTFNTGVEAIKHLIGASEDIRRFDIGLVVKEGEIPAERLNMLRIARPRREQKYTSDLCKRLILWAWTRKAATFTEKAEELCLKLSTELCRTFTEDIPLMDAGSGRYKLARIAAAIAARVYSHHNGELIVKCCHVQVAFDRLREIYSSETFGYMEFTRTRTRSKSIEQPKRVQASLNDLMGGGAFVQFLREAQTFQLQDIMDWAGLDREAAQVLVSQFVRNRCIVRKGSHGYVKTAPFADWLKNVEVDPVPDHIEKEEF